MVVGNALFFMAWTPLLFHIKYWWAGLYLGAFFGFC